MLRISKSLSVSTSVIGVFLSTIGCQLGPSSLRVSSAEYNEAIQRSAAEQLLLNLVRLKYRETPLVLDVGSISAQFEISQNLGIAGTLNENVGQAIDNLSTTLGAGAGGSNAGFGRSVDRVRGRNPDQLGLSGQFGYAERPTVTYSPLQGLDFAERMLTPISPQTIIKLTHSGWRIDRVLALTVFEMNGLDNVGAASGPTPVLAPEFEDFRKAIDLMRELQLKRAIALEYEVVSNEISEPLPIDRITPSVVLQAAAANARFRRIQGGNQIVLTQDSERPVLRLLERDGCRDQVAQLRRLLRLAPGHDQYPLTFGGSALAAPRDESGGSEALVIRTRSLMGVMFLLAQGVESPSRHLRAGFLTATVDKEGRPFDWSKAVGHLIRIHESRIPPVASALSVRRGGYWFYLRDDDLNSKSTFLLLGQLFSLRAGAASGGTPLLTLPL